ncbi:hypothetical protein [Actinokineospora diospyrosa]|uniref:Uncharacterized protein n=1 Tax=Actinokineospora diospyrosa TaxID=103728 RepID=A0ABT1IJK4_9PSEU|nr:hypothetical protein [Actinokineospora diospyrosa]MCP2272832.1 hypothetical protein [Actinokineospora diospyrosa]
MSEPARQRGSTPESNDLAEFLGAHTAALSAHELCAKFGNWAALWGEYRSGERIVPWHLLARVVADQVPDRRERMIALTRAKVLYDRAEAAAAAGELAGRDQPRRTRAVTAIAAATAVAALIATGVLRRTPVQRKATEDSRR